MRSPESTSVQQRFRYPERDVRGAILDAPMWRQRICKRRCPAQSEATPIRQAALETRVAALQVEIHNQNLTRTQFSKSVKRVTRTRGWCSLAALEPLDTGSGRPGR